MWLSVETQPMHEALGFIPGTEKKFFLVERGDQVTLYFPLFTKVKTPRGLFVLWRGPLLLHLFVL